MDRTDMALEVAVPVYEQPKPEHAPRTKWWTYGDEIFVQWQGRYVAFSIPEVVMKITEELNVDPA